MGRQILPVLALLLIAPAFGECLSTATAPLDLLSPWRLLPMVALYGCGALLCRELTRRFGLRTPGLCLLGAAYGVYEEAVVDRFWFDRGYARQVGVGDYARVWDVSLLLATHLTLFHVAVSVLASVLVVEAMFPARRDRAWVPAGALVLPVLALAAVAPLLWDGYVSVPASRLALAALLILGLVVAAFLGPRVPEIRRGIWPGRERRRRGPVQPRPFGAVVAIVGVCTAVHFVTVYAVPATGLAWPVGLGLSLAPIAVAAWLVGGSADVLVVVTGVVGFFALLDVAVGLAGRYDLSVFGAMVLAGLFWLRRRASNGGAPGDPLAAGGPAVEEPGHP